MASNKEKFYKRQLKQGKIDATQFAKIMGTAPQITEKNKNDQRVQMFNRYGSDPSLREKGTSVNQWQSQQESALQQRMADSLRVQQQPTTPQFATPQQPQTNLYGDVLLPSQKAQADVFISQIQPQIQQSTSAGNLSGILSGIAKKQQTPVQPLGVSSKTNAFIDKLRNVPVQQGQAGQLQQRMTGISQYQQAQPTTFSEDVSNLINSASTKADMALGNVGQYVSNLRQNPVETLKSTAKGIGTFIGGADTEEMRKIFAETESSKQKEIRKRQEEIRNEQRKLGGILGFGSKNPQREQELQTEYLNLSQEYQNSLTDAQKQLQQQQQTEVGTAQALGMIGAEGNVLKNVVKSGEKAITSFIKGKVAKDLEKDTVAALLKTKTEKEAQDILSKFRSISPVEAGVSAERKAALDYVESKPKATVIDPDLFKKQFNDYNPANHKIYSEMAKEQYTKALQENDNPVVHFLAGGSGSGKSEIILNKLKNDTNGIIYDGTLSNYKSAIEKIKEAESAGKRVVIDAILPRIESAWKFAQKRELTTGRGIALNDFVEKHVGFIDTLKKLVEEGYPVNLKDTRNIYSLDQAKKAEFISDPKKILDILDNLNYNKNKLERELSYVKLSEKSKQEAIAANERQRLSGISQGASTENVRNVQRGLNPDGTIPKRLGTNKINPPYKQGGAFEGSKNTVGKTSERGQRLQKQLSQAKQPQLQKRIGQQGSSDLGKLLSPYKSSVAEVDKNVKLAGSGFVKNIKKSEQVSADIKEKIAQQFHSVRNTEELAIKAKNLVKDDIEAAEQLARTGVDDKAVATQSELIKHYSELAKNATTQAEKNVLLDRASEIAGIAAENLTEAGRAIQAATIMGKMTPEGALRFAQGIIKKHNAVTKGPKIPNLSAEQTGNIIKRMEDIKLIMNPKEKAKAVFELNNYLSELVPNTLGQKIIQVWKAGLLTGVKTSGVNITSNIVHGVNEAAKDIPATIVDKVIGLFSGKRTKTFSLEGTLTGGREGMAKGWDYMRTGFDERSAGMKYDTSKVNFGKGKIAKALQKYSEGVFRVIGAEDQPFYYAAKARSLFEQAKVGAINKGLKGETFDNFVKNAVENPTDEMIKLAAADAEVATFTNKNILGESASALARKLGTTGEIIMPFRNTPSNVAIQAINYSPVGIVNTIIQNIGKGKFDQKAFSEGIGRGVIGSIEGFAVGSALYGAGKMTLDAPKTEKERNQWELEGKKPNSILVDGKWKSAGSLGPIGVSMLTAGHYQRALQEKGSTTAALSTMFTGTLKSLVDQTFLKGVSGVINAINDPLRFGETLAENTAGSAIPTIVADVARAADEYQREVKGIPSALKARIPGLRQTLPEKVDVKGEKLPEAGAVTVMADVFRSSEQRNQNDPVVKELGRLTDTGESGTPIDFKAKQKINGEDVELDQDKVNEVKTFVGKTSYPLYADLINSSYYKNLSDDKKANLIDNITSDIRAIAKHDILGDNGNYKTLDEVKNDIAVRKTYGKFDELMKKDDKSAAYNLYDSLSDEEKKTFNAVKNQEKPSWEKKKEVTPIKKDKFNEVYDLLKQDKTAEAEKVVADMTDAEYEDYKKARTAKRTSNSTTFKERLATDPKLAVQFARSLPKVEAERIINLLSDEDYDRYNTGKY